MNNAGGKHGYTHNHSTFHFVFYVYICYEFSSTCFDLQGHHQRVLFHNVKSGLTEMLHCSCYRINCLSYNKYCIDSVIFIFWNLLLSICVVISWSVWWRQWQWCCCCCHHCCHCCCFVRSKPGGNKVWCKCI